MGASASKCVVSSPHVNLRRRSCTTSSRDEMSSKSNRQLTEIDMFSVGGNMQKNSPKKKSNVGQPVRKPAASPDIAKYFIRKEPTPVSASAVVIAEGSKKRSREALLELQSNVRPPVVKRLFEQSSAVEKGHYSPVKKVQKITTKRTPQAQTGSKKKRSRTSRKTVAFSSPKIDKWLTMTRKDQNEVSPVEDVGVTNFVATCEPKNVADLFANGFSDGGATVDDQYMKNMDSDTIEEHVEQNQDYLQQIREGKVEESWRHKNFFSCSRLNRQLGRKILFAPFSEEQYDVMMEMLIQKFNGNKSRHDLDYILKVLATETVIKIFMDLHKLEYNEAEVQLLKLQGEGQGNPFL